MNVSQKLDNRHSCKHVFFWKIEDFCETTEVKQCVALLKDLCRLMLN